MKRNARAAYNALKRLGAPVYDHDGGQLAHFVIGAELRDSTDQRYCDYYQEEVKEHVAAGRIVNAFGIRQDVLDILAANGLFAEWINAGMVGVYDA